MRLTSFVVSRSWASNPLRTALSVLGVALGVAVVVAIHVVDHNTILSRLRQLRPNFGRVDLELAAHDPTRSPDAVRAALARRDDVAAVGVLQQGLAAVDPGDGARGPVHVYGLSPLPSEAFAHYWVADGEDLSPLDGDGAVLVGGTLAQLLDVHPGDRVRLSRPRLPPQQRCRGGELVTVPGSDDFEPFEREVVVKGVLADERLGRRDDGVLVVGSFALARELAPARPPLYQINREPGADVDRMRRELGEDFEVLDSRSALLGEASDERAFRNGVKVLGCLALVLGMFVVFQTLSQSLLERLRQIGVLRCLGASRRAIAGVFLADASATAAAGAALGVLLGIALAWGLQALDLSTLGRGKQVVTFELPPGPIAWTALLGVLFTLLGAAFPLWKARNVPAMAVLGARGMRQGSDGGEVYVLRGVNAFLFVALVLLLPGAYLAMTPLLAEEGGETLVVLLQLAAMVLVFGGVLLISPRVVQGLGALLLAPLRPFARLPVHLVQRALARSPGRFAAATCGLAVVLMALIALKSITAALAGDAVAFDARAMGEGVFVRTAEPIAEAEAEALAELRGVAAVEAFVGEVGGRFPLRGLPAAALAREGGPFADRPELVQGWEQSRAVVLSERLARLRGKSAGDTMALLTDEGPVDYTVLAVTDAVGFFPDERAWALAAPRWLRHDFCAGLDGVQQITLRLESDAEPHAVLAAVRSRLEAPWAKTAGEITAYNLRDIRLDFRLFDVLLALVLVVAAVGLVNTMTLAALGRAREIGVMRALGVSRAQLRAAFVVEGGLVAVTATLLAVVLAVPLGMMVVAGLNRVAGLRAPFAPPWETVAWVPVLALLCGLLAAVVPGTRALRESPADAVRYE